MAPAGAGGVVRLNACGLDLPAAGPGEEEDPARRLAARLVRLAGPWNSWAARFIDGWFARLALEIERDRSRLEARLAPFEGLYRPEDFLFSAPAPLPRAFFLAPPAEGTAPDAASERVQVDIGFFIAGRPVAVLASPSPLTPAATRRRAERLAAAGIDVVTASAAAIAGPEAPVFTDLLARLGGRFHDGEPLPSAPGAPVIGLF